MNCRGKFIVYYGYVPFLLHDYYTCDKICDLIVKQCLSSDSIYVYDPQELDTSRLFAGNIRRLRSLNCSKILLSMNQEQKQSLSQRSIDGETMAKDVHKKISMITKAIRDIK